MIEFFWQQQENGEYHIFDRNNEDGGVPGLLWEIHDNENDANRAVARLTEEENRHLEPAEFDPFDEEDEDFEHEPPADEPEPDPNRPHAWGIFTDHAQANQHLSRRLVIHDGKMVYVKRVMNLNPGEDKGKLYCTKPNGGGGVELPVDDAGFNSFRFDPLGWINSAQGAVLTYLRPIRQTHRGYGQENVGFLSIRHGGFMDQPDDLRLYDLFGEDGCAEMLRNEYPVFADVAKELLVREGMGIAVARQYAVSSDADGYVWLWQDGQRIAIINDPLTITLGKRFGYLREQLQEVGHFEGVWIK